MPLTEYFPNCCYNGTSWNQSGNRVNVVPTNGEIVKFFLIDPESNPNCKFRDIINLSGPICDLIVTYTNGVNQVRIICLTELKGNKINHAIHQVTNTQQALRNYNEVFRNANYRCYILIGGSAPIRINETIKRILTRNFGPRNYKITRRQNKDDLGKFLRGASIS
jgi:hypothetical protein